MPPWPKGQSGNKNGRPRGTVSLTKLLREALEGTHLGGVQTPDGRAVAEHFIDHVIGQAMKGNAAYMKEIMDRMEGKIAAPEPVPAIDLNAVVPEAEAIDAEYVQPPDGPPDEVPERPESV